MAEPANTATATDIIITSKTNDPAVMLPGPVKQGWTTTEFWLSLAAKLLGAAFAVGLVGDGSQLDRVAGLAAMVMTALGYQVNRSKLKASAGVLAATLMTACVLCLAVPGCAWLKSEGDVAKAAVIDCTTATAHDAIKQFGPILDALLVQATDPNGKVNWTPVKDLGKGLGTELGGCVLATVVAHELAPDKPGPNAPKSSPLELNAASLREGFDDIRRAQFHGASFKTDHGVL